ncbi:MAG TPA: spermidine/putrescine ABC transporter substrate-binding protein [Gaiellaceae bacterium]|nr:spermidine/putrescine ABC transporter substrate-binding protein [Gaiellaceae bacterium]
MKDPFYGMYDPLTRRQLLRRAAAGGVGLSLPAILAACGGGGGIEGQAEQTTSEAATTVEQVLADELTFANWPFYIDIDEDTNERPSLEMFTQETGVRVNYLEEVNDNEEWFGKYQAQLEAGDDIGRDIVVLTDWMAARMIKLGYVQRLDKSAIPNIGNLQDALASPGWDPSRDYSLPWQSGLTGIAYNKKTIGKVTTMDQLLTDPKLKGKVTLLTEMPDTMGIMIAAQGGDPSTVTPEAFDSAISAIGDAVESGQIRRFTGNDYTEDLASGNVWACMAWSGDIAAGLKNPNIEFTVVDTGSHIWTDNMLIPNGGDVYTASTYMNYVYDPVVAARIAAYVYFISPVKGAADEIAQFDETAPENPLIFPPDDVLAKTFIFDAEAADDPEYKEKFQAVIGA